MEEKNNNLTIIKKYRRRVWFFISFWFFEVALIIIFRKELENFDMLLFSFSNNLLAAFFIANPMANFFKKNYMNISKMHKTSFLGVKQDSWIKYVESDPKEINDWRRIYRCLIVSMFIVVFTSAILNTTLSF